MPFFLVIVIVIVNYPTLVVTITSTHCAYPHRDGQAELAWVAVYVVRQFTYHPTSH